MAKAAGGRQTSRKAGLTSTAKKMDNTRHGFSTPPWERKVAGADGAEPRALTREPGTATRKKGMAAALGSMKTTSRRATGAKAAGAKTKSTKTKGAKTKGAKTKGAKTKGAT